MPKRPFDFLSLPAARSDSKPRRTGLTMMIDMGQPPAVLRDYLGVAAHYIDAAKIFVGSARLYDEKTFREKSAIYAEHNIGMFLGGQFLEYVFHKGGWSLVPRFLDEVARLGVSAIEVSDNCITLSDEDRRRLINQAVDAGLRVHGEVGSKQRKADPEDLIAQARLSLEAGCDIVLFEAAELVEDGFAEEATLEKIRSSVAADQLMVELPGPWIRNVTLNDVYNMMISVIRGFGVDANIGNVMPDQVINLEALRCGLGIAGPDILTGN